MSNTGWAAVIVALLVIIGGVWWFSSQTPTTPAVTDTTAQQGTDPLGNGAAGGDTGAGVDVGVGDASTRVEIRYTASGFEPAQVTVVRGTAVTFINDTTGSMWVGADEHPTHTEFDGTDRATHCSGSYQGATPFDQCQNGSTYTFVFTKAGAYEYHNHSAAQFGGTITVQ